MRRNACATHPRHASNSSARRSRASLCHPSTTEVRHYARAISPLKAIEKDLSPVKQELLAGHPLAALPRLKSRSRLAVKIWPIAISFWFY
jgi:hypothetical protein